MHGEPAELVFEIRDVHRPVRAVLNRRFVYFVTAQFKLVYGALYGVCSNGDMPVRSAEGLDRKSVV